MGGLLTFNRGRRFYWLYHLADCVYPKLGFENPTHHRGAVVPGDGCGRADVEGGNRTAGRAEAGRRTFRAGGNRGGRAGEGGGCRCVPDP